MILLNYYYKRLLYYVQKMWVIWDLSGLGNSFLSF